MEENKIIMEEINEEVVADVCEGAVNTNGNLMLKLAVGAVGIAAAVGAVIFIKRRKARKNAELAEENVESEVKNEDE